MFHPLISKPSLIHRYADNISKLFTVISFIALHLAERACKSSYGERRDEENCFITKVDHANVVHIYTKFNQNENRRGNCRTMESQCAHLLLVFFLSFTFSWQKGEKINNEHTRETTAACCFSTAVPTKRFSDFNCTLYYQATSERERSWIKEIAKQHHENVK